MNNCNHQYTQSRWVSEYEDDWGTVIQGHYEYETVSTTVDIDTGRYKCTQCGEVMYYTGTWRKHWEGA
jgi:hypothetical protein